MKSLFTFVILLILSICFAVTMDLLLGYTFSECLQNLNNPFWLMAETELSTALLMILLMFLKPIIRFVKKRIH